MTTPADADEERPDSEAKLAKILAEEWEAEGGGIWDTLYEREKARWRTLARVALIFCDNRAAQPNPDPYLHTTLHGVKVKVLLDDA